MEQQIKLWSEVDDSQELWDLWDEMWLDAMKLEEKKNE